MSIEFKKIFHDPSCEKMKAVFLNGIKHIPLNENERMDLINAFKPLFMSLMLAFDVNLDSNEKSATLEMIKSEIERILEVKTIFAVRKIIVEMIKNAPGTDNEAMRVEMQAMAVKCCDNALHSKSVKTPSKIQKPIVSDEFDDPRMIYQSAFYLEEILTAVKNNASHLKLRMLISRALSVPDFTREQQLDMVSIIGEDLRKSAYSKTIQDMLVQYMLKHVKKTNYANPILSQRLPTKLAKTDYYINSSKREVTLIDIKSYNQFKQILVMLEQSGLNEVDAPHIASGFYQNSPQGQPLKHPIFIGQNGEMIAITIAKLGEGGFGAVFIGMDIDTGEFVAVKRQIANPKRNPIKDIRQEQLTMEELNRLVGKLEHGNTVYTVDSLGWGHDYTEAKSSVEADIPNNYEQVAYKCDMALALFNEIQALHQKGFIHRDIKLDNVLWDKNNKNAQLIDFGMTMPGSKVKTKDSGRGTPLYLAPETINGVYSTSSDVYACGVALLEIFLKDDDIFNYKDDWIDFYRENDNNSIYYLMSELAKKLDPVNPTIDKIRELILNMLSPNPDIRPKLSVVIAELKKIAINLNFEAFNSNKLNSATLVLSEAELQNPRIRVAIFSKIEKDETVLERISPNSLFILLKQITLSGNVKIFEKVADKFGLFDIKNAALHDVISKMILDKTLKSSSNKMTSLYLAMVNKLSIKDLKRVSETLFKQAISYGENKEKLIKIFNIDSSRKEPFTVGYQKKTTARSFLSENQPATLVDNSKPTKIKKN